MNVLLVEDEPLLQRCAARMLRRIHGQDVAIVVAVTAAEAVASILATEPALILCDYDLADGPSGGDVLEWIRANRPDLQIRFCWCSGNVEVETTGARVCAKPYSYAELESATLAAVG